MKIVVVGSGYVGLVTGVCFAEVGHEVVCVDNDPRKITMLRDGRAPIYEPGLEPLIERNAAHGRLTFTTSLAEALPDAVAAFIAVGTPEGENGSSDLKYVRAVAAEIGEIAANRLLVVVKSTVPVGTCDMVENVIQVALAKRFPAEESNKPSVSVASNPEFLKEGTAIDDFMKPDRIVAGVAGLRSEENARTFRDMYAPFIQDDPGRLQIMQRRSSEMTKYAANSMLATRISFMNELSRLCEAVGANIDDVRRGIGSDPRIGKKFLYAGPGYGGSCFPKDVEALLATGRENDSELAVLRAVSHANREQKKYVAAKIHRYFKGDLSGRRIAVWGLAFKPGTDDVREAPALTIISQLIEWGATVVAHDPVAQETFTRAFQQYSDRPGAGSDSNSARLTMVADAYDAVRESDALVLVTEWAEYKQPSLTKIAATMREKVVFDFRNQYSFDAFHKAGFHYECIGRLDSVAQEKRHD